MQCVQSKSKGGRPVGSTALKSAARHHQQQRITSFFGVDRWGSASAPTAGAATANVQIQQMWQQLVQQQQMEQRNLSQQQLQQQQQRDMMAALLSASGVASQPMPTMLPTQFMMNPFVAAMAIGNQQPPGGFVQSMVNPVMGNVAPAAMEASNIMSAQDATMNGAEGAPSSTRAVSLAPKFPDDRKVVPNNYRFFGGAWKRNPRTVLPRDLKQSMLESYKPQSFTPIALAGCSDEQIDELLFIVFGISPAAKPAMLRCPDRGAMRTYGIREASRLHASQPTRLEHLAQDFSNSNVVAARLGYPLCEMSESRRVAMNGQVPPTTSSGSHTPAMRTDEGLNPAPALDEAVIPAKGNGTQAANGATMKTEHNVSIMPAGSPGITTPGADMQPTMPTGASLALVPCKSDSRMSATTFPDSGLPMTLPQQFLGQPSGSGRPLPAGTGPAQVDLLALAAALGIGGAPQAKPQVGHEEAPSPVPKIPDVDLGSTVGDDEYSCHSNQDDEESMANSQEIQLAMPLRSQEIQLAMPRDPAGQSTDKLDTSETPTSKGDGKATVKKRITKKLNVLKEKLNGDILTNLDDSEKLILKKMLQKSLKKNR